MGRSVDERIVQMQFDNASFERNAKQSMSTIDALKQKLDFSGSAKGLASLQNTANSFDMSGVGNAIGTVQAKFSALQVVGMTVIANLTNSAINMLKRITANTIGLIKTGGISRAMNIESAKFSLQGLGIAWKDAYDSIDFGVTNTAYGLDSAAKAASQLAASGVDLYKQINVSSIDAANGNKKVTRTTTQMGESLKAISAVAAQTNSDFDSIASIFTTVAGQGKVMTEQMNQLAYRGMNAFTVVGDRIGKTEKEVRDMVSKGQIDYNTFMDAMYYKFAENAGKANETLTGVTSNIRAALSKIGALFFSPLVENGGALVKMLDAIREKLNQFKTLLDNSGLDDTFASIQKDFFSKIESSIRSLDISNATKAFVNYAKGIGHILSPIIGVLKSIASAFADIFGGTNAMEVERMSETFEKITQRFVLSSTAIDGIQGAFRSLFQIIRNVKNVFITMFPIDFGEIVNKISGTFNKLASSLSYNSDAVQNFYKLTQGLFSLIDTGYTIIKAIITGLFPNLDEFFSDTLSSAGTTFVNLAGYIGDALLKFNEFVHTVVESDNPIKTIFSALGNVFEVLKEVFADIWSVGSTLFGSLFKSIISLAGPLVEILKKIVDAIKIVLDSIANGEKIDWAKAFGIAGATATLTYFWKRITWFLGRFKRFGDNLVQIAETGFLGIADTFTSLKNMAGNIAGIPLKLGRAFQGFANEKNTTAIFKLAAAVGILALSMVALSTIEPEKLSRSLSTVIVLVVTLAATASFLLNSFSKFGKLKYAIGDWTDVFKNAFTSLQLFMKLKGLGSVLLKLAAGVAILSVAVIALSKLEWGDLAKGLVGVVALLAAFTIAASKLSTSLNPMQMNSIVALLISLSASILILAVSVRSFAKMDSESLLQGLIGVFGLIAAVTIMANQLKTTGKGETKSFVKLGVGMIAMAIGIRILASSVKTFSAMDDTALLQGLISVVGLLAAVTIMTNYIKSEKMLAIGAGMVLISAALKLMASSVQALGAMDDVALLQGLIAVMGMLAGVSLALTYMANPMMLAGAAAMLIAASAFTVFSIAIAALTKCENVGTTILKIAGSLLVLFVATALAAIASPLVLAFSVALGVLGLALGVAGVGLIAFTSGFGALAAILSGGIATIIAGISVLAIGLAKAAVIIGKGVANAIGSFLSTMATKLPEITAFFGTAISALINALSEAIPKVVDAGVNFITSLVSGIASNVGKIVSVAAELVGNFLSGLGEKIPTIVQAGVDLMVNFIDGLANGIRDNTGKVISAVGNLISAIIESILSLLQYLVEDIPVVGDDMARGLEDAKGKVQEVLQYDSMTTIGNDAMSGVVDGIKENVDSAESAGAEIGDSIQNGLADSMNSTSDSSDSSLLDTLGINSETGATAGSDMGTGILEGIQSTFTGGGGSLDMSSLTESFSNVDLSSVGVNWGNDLMGGLNSVDMGSVGSDMGIDFTTALGSTDVVTVATEMGTEGSDAASETAPQYKAAGKNAGEGFISGIKTYYSTAGSVGGSLGTASLNGLKNALGIHSPSKEFGIAAWFSVLGYVNAMKKYSSYASDASAEMGEDSVDALLTSCEKVANSMNSENAFTITPVIDMSVMEAQLQAFDSTLGTRTIALAKATTVSNQNGIAQQLNDLTEAVNRMSESQNSEVMNNMYGLMSTYFPEFTKDVVLDGRKVSKGTASYMNDDIVTITRFNNLLAGVK